MQTTVGSSSTVNEHVVNITNLLSTAFGEHNITIYGTWEEPLFKANDIGDMLGIKHIRTSLTNATGDDVRSTYVIDSLNRPQETTMLTESGLYKVLFKSRKEAAQTFQEHVCKLLKQERLKLGEQLQLDSQKYIAIEKEKMLLEKHKGKSGVYFLKDTLIKIVKFGSSKNVTERVKTHKRDFGKDNIYLDKVVETPKYNDLENSVRKYANTTHTDLRNHTHTEIIEYTEESELDSIYTQTERECKLIKAPPDYNPELEIEKERTKQEEARVKQLELQVKIMELKVNGCQKVVNLVEETVRDKDGVDETESNIVLDQGVCNKAEQKTELKMDRNPLFKFLTENSVYKEGNVVALEIVRSRFASWLGTSVKSLDNGTFYQVNKRYEIVKCMICKHCGKAAEKGCCVLYKNSDRTCKKVAKNFCFLDFFYF